jgi:hypothetical protein
MSLEEFGEPVFPEIRWFNALNLAASEYERLGPIVELPPLHGNYQKSSGSDKLGPGHARHLSHLIGRACDSWLSRRGIASDRLH